MVGRQLQPYRLQSRRRRTGLRGRSHLLLRQLLSSFQTIYDNIWTNTVEYANYANITGQLVRVYPLSPIDSRLNFLQRRLLPGSPDPVDRSRTGAGQADRRRHTGHPGAAGRRADPRSSPRRADQDVSGAQRAREFRQAGTKSRWTASRRPPVSGDHRDPDAEAPRLQPSENDLAPRPARRRLRHLELVGRLDDNQLEANIFTDRMPGDPLNDTLFDDLHAAVRAKW